METPDYRVLEFVQAIEGTLSSEYFAHRRLIKPTSYSVVSVGASAIPIMGLWFGNFIENKARLMPHPPLDHFLRELDLDAIDQIILNLGILDFDSYSPQYSFEGGAVLEEVAVAVYALDLAISGIFERLPPSEAILSHETWGTRWLAVRGLRILTSSELYDVERLAHDSTERKRALKVATERINLLRELNEKESNERVEAAGMSAIGYLEKMVDRLKEPLWSRIWRFTERRFRSTSPKR